MELGKLTELSIGLAAFLGALFLLLKYKPWKTETPSQQEVEESGRVAREVWEAFFKEQIRLDGEITRKSIRQENECQIDDMRKLLESRVVSLPKDILEPLLRDSERTRDELREAIQSAVTTAYQMGERRRNPR